MKKLISRTILIIFILFISRSYAFLHADGTRIVDSSGENVVLRGMGLGGWMLMEGYMMKTSSFAGTQHEMEAHIGDLIGESGKNEFFRLWQDNHVTRRDIDSLAAWGFNSVRLPMHYKLFTLPIEEEPVSGEHTWLERGFQLTDSLLNWCAANEMYLILDLHAAPGGQGKDANISDYDPSKPSLWESTANREKTVALWRRIAEYYADEPWIGGYDLLNETNWDLTGNYLLRALYGQITEAIRSVDENHLIFIEGNWFANDFTGLRTPWDDNMAYSFHKYWSNNYIPDIQYVLDLRDQTQRPIWMGEAGENSNHWFRDAIALFESANVGWAWWPMKKIDNLAGIYSINMTDGYRAILDYWEGNASRPSQEYASAHLLDLARSSNSLQCRLQKDVVDAISRQPHSSNAIPFKINTVPGTVYAADFDMGPNTVAYYDMSVQNLSVSSGTYTAWNEGWSYRNDAVDVGYSSSFADFPYYVGWTENGEWIKISVFVQTAGEYVMDIRYANGSGYIADMNIDLDNEILYNGALSPGSGWDHWLSARSNIQLPAGQHSLKISFPQGGLNLYALVFTLLNASGTDTSPSGLLIRPVYPNPSAGMPDLVLTSLTSGSLKVNMYNILGQKILSLYDDTLAAGDHRISAGSRLRHLASGIYFYRIDFNNQYSTVKFSYLQ